jgi:lipid II:glycine glycyltransferase (peptidoglycan interpeptide bridge formation enzyme)
MVAAYQIHVPDPAEWDAFVSQSDGDVLAQTTAWARTKGPGDDFHIVAVRHGPQIVGGCVLLDRRVGPLRLRYAARGPILAAGHEGAAAVLVRALLETRIGSGPNALVLQPAAFTDGLDQAMAAAGFTHFPLPIAPAATVQVPLGAGVDAVFEALRSSRRRNIRRAERSGVKVRLGSIEDMPLFHELHAQTAARQGFAPMTLRYLTQQWEVLAPDDLLRLYIAELDGEALSAATVTAFGDRMVFKLAGLSESAAARDSRASELLHWRIIVDACEGGFAYYDLGGFDRDAAVTIEQGGEPPEEIRASASQFKLGFGGEVRALPEARWLLRPRPAQALQRPLAALVEHSDTVRSMAGRLRTL